MPERTLWLHFRDMEPIVMASVMTPASSIMPVVVLMNADPCLTTRATMSTLENNTWSFDSTEKYADTKEKVVQEAHKERDRRVKAVAIVKYFKSRLDETFPPRTSAKYLSALFRQRGVPSLDIFTA